MTVVPARLAVADGRMRWTSRQPVVLRRTGVRRMHLVAVGGGPLGGDVLALEVDVAAGEHLDLRSAAATVVQPGRLREPARLDVTIRLAEGAHLTWYPEPTVVCDHADWRVAFRLDLAAGAHARVVEQIVLGRAGQVGGRVHSTLDVTVDGTPLLLATTVLDGADPALRGPGGDGGARSTGTVLDAGDVPASERAGDDGDVVWARSPLAGPGTLTTAAGSSLGVGAFLAREVQECSDDPAGRASVG